MWRHATKYGNRKVTVNGITYDSKKEARRAQELEALQAAGEITPEGKKSSRGAADMAGGRRSHHSHTKH